MSRSRNAYEPPSDAPVVNPYDRFTQGDFDDYVTGLRSKICDALDPRRGLKNRDRDSEISFGLPRGEFRFGRSVSVGESSFAPSGQSVPRSSVEDERGDRRFQYNDEEGDPESDTSDQEDQGAHTSHLAIKPAIVVSGEGDEESPFVISDDDDEDEKPAPAGELTPRSKAHLLLGLQGDEDEDEEGGEDDDEEGDDDEVEDDDAVTSSPPRPRPQLASEPLNLYDDIDDIELIEDDSVEGAEENAFDVHVDTLGGSSPPWPEQVEAEGDPSEDVQAPGSVHSFDEFFVANIDHLPPGFASAPFEYDQPGPEMRGLSGDTTNLFPQMMPSGSNPIPSLSNEGIPQILPTQNPGTFAWPVDEYPGGSFGMPGFVQDDVAEEASQASTLREDSRGITYPNLPAFNTGGHFSVFGPIGYPTQTYHSTELMFAQPTAHFDASGGGVPTSDESATAERYDGRYTGSEEPLPLAPGAGHPDVTDEPREDMAPQFSEDIGSAVTPSLTPPLSPSGVTLTAPEPSLLSDNSSAGTSVPVAFEPAAHTERRIGFEEFVENVEDLTLPEEVTQELTQDVNLLPDPHRVPEPTLLGIPEGVAGLATRVVEPSVWAEPPTPSRSEYVEDEAPQHEGSGSVDTTERTQPPPPLPFPSEGVTSRNLTRVRWRNHDTGSVPPVETPATELETLKRELLQPTPLETPVETPREEFSCLERSLILPTPTQTPLETPREELDILAQRLVAPAPYEAPAETPREELQSLEQSLLTGGSAVGTPLNTRGALTRDSTMTEAAWSQGPMDPSPLKLATSATLTGDSYFPSQPISSPSRRASFERVKTQETLGSSLGRHSPDAEYSVGRSTSPISDGSPLSEDDQDVSTSKLSKRSKRAARASRTSSSVKIIGQRELRALQKLGSPVDGPRPRRTVSKPALQANKGPARPKGKQKASPISKKDLPKIATANSSRLRALRSNSLASPAVSTVSKQMSPTSTTGSDEASKVSSRDEIDLLGKADGEELERNREREREREWEREHEEAEDLEYGDEHPKKKRKRHPRVSIPGDDEDYLPEDVERSLKKRKLEARGHDLDESLDTIDLGSVLEAAEANTSTTSAKQKKPKKKERPPVRLEEAVNPESSSDESVDRGSEFIPSPDVEQPPEALNGDQQALDAETFSRLSPAAQARHRKGLNPDSRAYKPSESSESEDEEPTKAALIEDLKGVVEGIEDKVESGDGKDAALMTAVPAEEEAGSTAPKKRQRKHTSGARKSKKTGASAPAGQVDPAPEKLSELKEEGVESRDIEMELEGDGDGNDEKRADAGGPSDGVTVSANAPAPGQPLPQQANESSWRNFGVLRFWRSNNASPAPPGAPISSPPTDQMDID